MPIVRWLVREPLNPLGPRPNGSLPPHNRFFMRRSGIRTRVSGSALRASPTTPLVQFVNKWLMHFQSINSLPSAVTSLEYCIDIDTVSLYEMEGHDFFHMSWPPIIWGAIRACRSTDLGLCPRGRGGSTAQRWSVGAIQQRERSAAIPDYRIDRRHVNRRQGCPPRQRRVHSPRRRHGPHAAARAADQQSLRRRVRGAQGGYHQRRPPAAAAKNRSGRLCIFACEDEFRRGGLRSEQIHCTCACACRCWIQCVVDISLRRTHTVQFMQPIFCASRFC